MLSGCFVICSWVIAVIFLSLGSHGISTGSDIPNDPLWPLFAELLSAQTGRTVQDINTLGLGDPTIYTMWTTYQASMPKLDTSSSTSTQQSSSPSTPDLYQPSYSFSSQPTSTNTVSGTSTPSTYQELLQAYQNIMSSGGTNTGSNQMSMLTNMMSGSTAGSTSTSPSPSYTDLVSQYNAIMEQSGTSPTNSLSVSTSSPSTMTQMMNAYSQMLGGQSSTMNQMMNVYSNMLSGQSTTATPAADNPSLMINYLNQVMASGQTAPSGGSYLDQMVATYNQLLATGGSQPQTPTTEQSNDTSTSVVSPYAGSVDMNGPSSVDGSLTGTATNNQQSTGTSSTASSFDQQLVELFPQFKNVMPSSTSSSSSTPAPPTVSTASPLSSNSSDPQNALGISSSNSAQQIFDVLLFGQGSQPSGQSNTQTASGTGTSGSSTPTPTATNNNQVGIKSPLEQFLEMKNNAKNPGKILSSHVQNVWKTRASRDMGCRFLPELLDMDILPTVPIDCRNKCPFPYINAQRFGIYCVCCPPGVNDQLVSALSLLRRPSFINDNPLTVVS